MENEPEFLLRRANEETLKAIGADEPAAADAHEELSIRYSAKAAEALSDNDELVPREGSGGVTISNVSRSTE